MRLRNYLLTLFTVSFSLLILLFAFQTDSMLRGGFKEIHGDQLRRIEDHVKAVVKSKEERLDALLHVALQAETLQLDRLKKEARLEIAHLYPTGTRPSDDEMPWGKIESSAKSDKVTFVSLYHQGMPSLIGFVKVKNRILLMGYHFNKAVEDRVAELNRSQIQFKVVTPKELKEHPELFLLYDTKETVMVSRIVPDTSLNDTLSRNLLWGLLAAGLLCLGLFAGILYLFLERGFLRGFRSLLKASQDSVGQLKEGQIPNIPQDKHFVSENSSLAGSLHTFARAIEQYKEIETEAARTRMAEQVAHDLRSPVSALEMLITSLDEIAPEKYQAINGCLNRIKTMANSVLRRGPALKGTSSTEAPSVCLNVLLENILEEKRAQYQANEVELSLRLPKGSNAPVFAQIREEELKRAVSNLLDNAVEAVPGPGKVVLSLATDGSKAVVTVSDTGRGIPSSLIPRIGERGFTANKPGGSGLGLHFAICVITDHKGTLSIESDQSKGTMIRIELPCAEVPSWYVANLDLARYSQVVVTDDDHSVHLGWDQKLSGMGVNIVHLFSPQELESWLSINAKAVPKTFFFCDYEFTENERNGLETLAQLKLQVQSILVTGKAMDPAIQRACTEHAVRLLSKETLLNFRITKRAASKSRRLKTA